MKTLNVLVHVMQLSPIIATSLHISINNEDRTVPIHIEDLIGAGSAKLRLLSPGDDDFDEPYGLTIKKSTVSDIQGHVTQDFLTKFPETITFSQVTTDFNSQKLKQSPWGKYNEVDVKIPALVSCKSRVSEFVKFKQDRYGRSEVLQCRAGMDDDGICRERVKHPLKQAYKPEDFTAVATVSGEESNLSFTAETNYHWVPSFWNPENPHATKWEFEWTPIPEQRVGFNIELDAGTSCVPGMVHVELDCSVETRRYWWDTTWSSIHEWFNLEYQTNRHEAAQPYANAAHKTGEQYCSPDWVLVSSGGSPCTRKTCGSLS
ncbi:hypothetical protein DL98DRAFT_575560 [Cadophora sp. DSE1049]|nr:hypothetical protein DL98DRAFT_575560 [Cadophora sp. DSE1049]